MEYSDNPMSEGNNTRAIFSALVLLSLSLLGFVIIGPVIGFLMSLPFIDVSLIELQSILGNPSTHEDGKLILYFMQSGATLGMFFMPALYVKVKGIFNQGDFFQKPLTSFSLPLALVITITFMGVNSIFVDWNANFTFPEFLKGFEEWARAYEEQGEKMTKFLTDFSSVSELFIALMIIAVFPAIAEEYVFRGLVQKKLFEGTKNIHVAIWVSAILFSAIHLQFFGFVPRMLLGALFGYLYFWSGNFWVPVVAHFTNNGFTLIMIYLVNSGTVDYDIQNTESPTLASVGLFSIITFALIYYFRKLNTEGTPNG